MPGMAPPTLGRLWESWNFSPIADAALAIGSVGYLVLYRTARRAGHSWPVGRLFALFGAVLTIVIAVNSSVATYSHDLFWVHMVAHLLLIMVAPVAFVWAAPWRLLDLVGGRGSSIVAGLTRSKVWRVLTSPAISVPLYTAVLVLTHLTGFQQAMQTHMWIHNAETVLYLVAGYLLFLPLTGNEATVSRLPYLIRFVVLAFTMGADTLVGLVLMMTEKPLAPGFAAMHPDWGPGALADQRTAGAIMWVGGDGLMMVLMIVTAIAWGRSSQQEQGLGRWLEGIRRRQLLGEGPDELGSDSGDDDVDVDQQLLDAYNLRLATLNGHPSAGRPSDDAPMPGRRDRADPRQR